MEFFRLQQEHEGWVNHNFPDQEPWEPLLGLAEEVGELAHVELKMKQGIRTVNREDAIDAVGDIVIFLTSYCNSAGIDLDQAVTDTWHKVKQRDWRANPKGEGY